MSVPISFVSNRNVTDLFSGAQVSQQATGILVQNLNDSATALAACQGVAAENLDATEAIIVVEILDASGSMSMVEDEVRRSVREQIIAWQKAKAAVAMMVTMITFNETTSPAFANRPIEDLKDNDVVYRAGGTTALYDGVLDGLSGALAYEEQLLRGGTSTRVIVVVYSDGADNASHRASAAKIKTLADELLRRENWILAFVGFKTGEPVDYLQVAARMGFPTILEIDLREPDEYKRQHRIRELFQLVSKSVIRQSQTMVDPNASANGFFSTN
jgi:Mg-chelatase subunit ChlD